MRIGLYGMPSAGKSYILERIDFVEVIQGSRLLRQMNPNFDSLDHEGRKKARSEFAEMQSQKDNIIVDGHYAFGDEIAFTELDGIMYDVFIYIFVAPDLLKHRMQKSEHNRKYLNYDIAEWQKREVEGLREYCHIHKKDFYVIDNPPQNEYVDLEQSVEFIRSIVEGHSCFEYAKECVSFILQHSTGVNITLMDGDKTITCEDTSSVVFDYKTSIFDGNFYTGFQTWRQEKEFMKYDVPLITDFPCQLNNRVLSMCQENPFILTSGHRNIWGYISSKLGYEYFHGNKMSAETKYFITKLLQEAGKYVIAFGDGMNDYYMLKQANEGYLVTKPDGIISRSLVDKDLEGLKIVCAESKL